MKHHEAFRQADAVFHTDIYLNPGLRWVVSTMLRPLDPWMGPPRASVDSMEKKNFFPSTGNQTTIPVLSSFITQSLYYIYYVFRFAKYPSTFQNLWNFLLQEND